MVRAGDALGGSAVSGAGARLRRLPGLDAGGVDATEAGAPRALRVVRRRPGHAPAGAGADPDRGGWRTPPAYRRAVAQGHGWYGFGLDVAEARKRVAALQQAAGQVKRPAELGPLEISVTPPGYDVPDRATIEAYAVAGVHRLILRPPPTLDASGLEHFAAETGRTLGLAA